MFLEYHLVRYFAKFTLPISQVHFAKLGKSMLPNSMSQRQHCQVHFTMWSGLPKWASSSWQAKTFLGCPMPKFFPVCQNFYPKNSSCPLYIYLKFLHELLPFTATPPLLLQVLSFFSPLLFLLVIWCLFEAWEQPFQNWSHSLNLLNLVGKC